MNEYTFNVLVKADSRESAEALWNKVWWSSFDHIITKDDDGNMVVER